jgi:hypothetical protein
VKRILLGGLALGLMAVVVPSASAADPDTIHGGCFFDTNSQATATNGSYIGVIGDHSVTTTSATPPAPTSATVTCAIAVNDSVVGSTSHSYGDVGGVAGVQGGADQISFSALPTDSVKLCETVAYADGFTSGPTCSESTSLQLPPQVVIDTLNGVFDTLTALEIAQVDPLVCPQLKAHAGSYPGGINIAPDGDLTVPDPLDLGLNPVWDCPPYLPAP